MATAAHWSQYLALRTLSAVMQCFDVEENLRTVGAFGSIYATMSSKRRQRASMNIIRSFPGISQEHAEQIAEDSIRNMFQIFAVDSLAMPQLLTRDNWPDRVMIGDLDEVLPLLVREDPGLFLTGHAGNWEILGYFVSLLGFRMTALARPIDNPLINKWLLDLRERNGLRILTKFGATNEVDRLVEQGERIGFIADQNAGDKGLFVPFLGRLASSYKSIGLLAMRHEVPVVAGFAKRVPGQFRYEVMITDIIRPDDWVDQPDPLFYISARFNRAVEQFVRLVPEQYLWVHRRWKSRPKWEREGKPMPARMIAKLETLPWMTPALLARIQLNSAVDAGLEPLERALESDQGADS
ncbi:MAG: lysophospholipid acyltransferase family protein [Phycisphaerales bacterium]|nr:lysophospholipid acyltransferase family protein [Phycisphaerales bacterium]